MKKKVLIIGASSGLGRRLAELYAAEGCNVGVIGRRENLLLELQQQFSENIFVCKADITNTGIKQPILELINMLHGVDIIIMAASIVHFNTNLILDPEIETIHTNVIAYTNVINTAGNYLKQRESGQIVGITSIAGARGNKIVPAYHASKAFQSVYLESLRIKAKYEKNNITITELIPGYIDTAMGKGDRMFWVSSVDKAARQCKKAIDKKKSKAFITKRWRLIYMLLKFLPIFIYDPLMNGSWKMKHKPK